MNIKLDRTYYLESDDMSFMLVYYDKKGNRKVNGYYGTLEQLIKSFINVKLRKSNATTLKEIKQELEELKTYVHEQLKLTKDSDIK